MTFLEAAIEVLRDASDPLHYSEIARVAVDRKLLSHVGRDPESAMQKCLTSAVRAGSEALLERAKPAHYQIRPGATLPERPAPAPKPRPAARKKSSSAGTRESGATKAASTKKKRSRGKGKATDAAPDAATAAAPTDAAAAAPAGPAVEFEAPEGSGVEGVTDVAMVMANAMTQLAEASPELKRAFDASQTRTAEDGPMVVHKVKGRIRGDRAVRSGGEPEERGTSKRRRRRRRKTKKVDWGATGTDLSAAATEGSGESLIARAAAVLEAAGPRSMHVRQLAESLAKQGALGGDVSEIERTVTADILADVAARGENSRFIACGDARYEARGVRAPEAARAAESAFRAAADALVQQTQTQLRGWLGMLGARGLEALVRMYLKVEGYRVRSTMVPARGVCKLVVEDPHGDDERWMVVVVPQKSSVEMRACEADAERAQCGGVLAFIMGDLEEEFGPDVRVVGAEELAGWLAVNEIGVRPLTLTAPVLDAKVIESIRGLDT